MLPDLRTLVIDSDNNNSARRELLSGSVFVVGSEKWNSDFAQNIMKHLNKIKSKTVQTVTVQTVTLHLREVLNQTQRMK